MWHQLWANTGVLPGNMLVRFWYIECGGGVIENNPCDERHDSVNLNSECNARRMLHYDGMTD